MKKREILVAPSILAADFGRLKEEIKEIEAGGGDLIHIDVMDGHFVPNITIGPGQVAAIKSNTHLALDVHLMIEEPFKLLDSFVEAGADIITIHSEVISLASLREKFEDLKLRNVRLGLALKPDTSLEDIKPVVGFLDFILLMSVNPGFCGQKFMPLIYPKIEALRKIFNFDIEVDGGVNKENAPKLISCGANVLVAGNYIFKASDIHAAIRSLKDAG